MKAIKRVSQFMVAMVLMGGGVAQAEFDCKGKAKGNHANPDDCHTYIACVADQKRVMPCPKGLVFNPKSGEKELRGGCVAPEEYACTPAKSATDSKSK